MAVNFEVISDTIEEGTENAVKWVKKNKWFAIAIGITVVLALYALYKKRNGSVSNSDTAEVSTYAYVPTGYEGLPTMSAGATSDFYDDIENIYSYLEEVKTNNEETVSKYEGIISKIKAESEEKISNIINSYNSDKLSFNETVSYLEEQNQKQAIINQMSQNSTLYGMTDDETQKRALHEANKSLGAKLGASFDSSTGTWWLNGERLYFTTNEIAGVSTPVVNTPNNYSINSNPSNTGDITKTVEQMQSNSNAWHTATAEERKRLEAENQKLGSSIGATFNSSSGKWSLNGADLYSGSSNKSSTNPTTSTPTNSKSSNNSTSAGSTWTKNGRTYYKDSNGITRVKV